MKRNINRRFLSAAVVILAASQSYPVQAADNADNSQYAPPGYTTSSGNYPPPAARDARDPRAQQYQSRQGYGKPDNYRNYPPPPYYGDREFYREDNSMPWQSRRRDNKMPWESSRGSSKMPWESRRGGRSNMPWDSGRGGWMDKDKFSDSWDDMLNAPSDMGEMPGGWKAPTVSVPNPVDVGDEFGDAARDAPDQMHNVYDDNRRSNR